MFLANVTTVICIIFSTSYDHQIKAQGLVKAVGPEMILVDFRDVALNGEHLISVKQCVVKP